MVKVARLESHDSTQQGIRRRAQRLARAELALERVTNDRELESLIIEAANQRREARRAFYEFVASIEPDYPVAKMARAMPAPPEKE